jgi:hypothetical protein
MWFGEDSKKQKKKNISHKLQVVFHVECSQYAKLRVGGQHQLLLLLESRVLVDLDRELRTLMNAIVIGQQKNAEKLRQKQTRKGVHQKR